MPAISAQLAPAVSPRQQREAAYYDEYARRHAPVAIDLTPVRSDELRPWSPYWTVCRFVRDAHRSPDQRLLDFGCGMGVAAVTFASVGYRVTGIDISQGNLAVAARLADKQALSDRCEFKVMAGERLDFPDATFDVVTGIDILHHTEVAAALRELHRVLKPGGVAIFKEPLADNPLDAVRDLVRVRRRASLDRDVHVTEDERKLTGREVALIRDTFDNVECRRFSVLQRLYRVDPNRFKTLYWKLQKLDHALMRRSAALHRLGDVGVFRCVK